MYGCDFGESYYPHTCVIVPEKDVLDTDILGSGYFSHARRWWHDLFLLSYSSHGTYYTSYHAMLLERYKQYRRYRSRIHPMSKFRSFWECLILHVIILKEVIFHFTSTFLFDKFSLDLYCFGAFLEIFIIWDLYFSVKTGYLHEDARQVILDTKRCFMKFCSTKLFLHVAAAIPLHWLMFLRYGGNVTCGMCKTNKFNCALKIISIFGFLRMVDASSYWLKNTTKIHFYKFVRLAVIGLVFMAKYYDMSDAVSLMMFMDMGYVEPNSTLAWRAAAMYAPPRAEIKGGDEIPTYKYVFFDMSRIFNALLLFSFGYRGKLYYVDKLTSLFAFLIANGFFVWSILECYSLVSHLTYANDAFIRKKQNAFNLLASHQLSDKLLSKVVMYYEYKHTRPIYTETSNELYLSLPTVLRREIKISCYMKLVKHITLFTDWPITVLEDVVVMLKKQVYLPNDVVAEAFVQGDGLMIVDTGVLAVYSPDFVEIGHLIDGDYFGEVSLVTDRELYMSVVVAVTPCTILLLEKSDFRLFMRKHPKLFYEMKRSLKEKYRTSVVSTEGEKKDDDLSEMANRS